MHPCVRAKASNDTISWCKADQDDWTLATQYTPENAGDLLERLWAYMSIRQLSTDYLSEENQEKIAATKKKLLQLSLKVTQQISNKLSQLSHEERRVDAPFGHGEVLEVCPNGAFH